MKKLEGKIAMVTGSGRGIGQAIAQKLASEGAKVVVNDLDAGPAEETIARIRALGSDAIGCLGDVTAPDFGARIVKATHQVRHEAFVNLAGWALSEPDEGRYYLDSSSTEDKAEFTDPFVEIDKGEAMAFGKPLFAELAGPARDGCAFSLMLRLQDLDVSHGA